MATRKYITVSLIFGSLFLLTPLLGEVLAQEEDINVESTDFVSETTTESIEQWYKSDRISGRVNMNDFVVGPGRTEINLQPGETAVQEVSVTNRISEDRRFILEVEDATGTSDGSIAIRMLGDQRGPYSIQDFISFPEDTFDLELGERARIPVTITIPPDTEPGGYYGSVLVSTVRINEDDGDIGPRSPIVARIGSLFFITVGGDIEQEGATQELSIIDDKLWYEQGPIRMGVLFENTGSVHVNPYGEISITNMFGEEVGFIELEPWFVMPKSLRLREVIWDREFLLGRYTAIAKINRGYDDIVDEVEVSFWVMPWKVVGGTFLVLFIIIFSMRAFFRTFEFKRKGA